MEAVTLASFDAEFSGVKHLEEMEGFANISPSVNQIEVSPHPTCPPVHQSGKFLPCADDNLTASSLVSSPYSQRSSLKSVILTQRSNPRS